MVSPVLFSSETGEWATPQGLYLALHEEFAFQLDAAASHENAKCPLYYAQDGLWSPNGKVSDEDGLTGSWAQIAASVFVNPPYGRGLGDWVKKADEESIAGATVVMLLPARTDTKWFWDHCYDTAFVYVRFIKGRLRFGGAANSAPFPSMVVVFEGLR